MKKTIWKTIEKPLYLDEAEYVSQLISQGYRVSDWIQDIFSAEKSSRSSTDFPIALARLMVSELGFEEPTTLQEIYRAMLASGYEFVPPLIALHSRFVYDEQPTGEWLRLATPMNAMIDSDGVPHLPKLGKALGLFFIETYWAYEQAVFHPHNEFVVAIR